MSGLFKTICLLLGLCAPASAAPASAQHTNWIGYIGCSASRDSVAGYHAVPGNKNYMWPSYDTGDGRIDRWADPSSSYWTLFQGMVNSYGQPQAVWVQLCEQLPTHPNTYAQVKAMLSILKSKAPAAVAYISAINAYNPPTLCRSLGTSGQGKTNTDTWAAQAVAQKLAQAGPVMGPLTPATVISDDCHSNQAGRNLLGQQLQSLFDTLN